MLAHSPKTLGFRSGRTVDCIKHTVDAQWRYSGLYKSTSIHDGAFRLTLINTRTERAANACPTTCDVERIRVMGILRRHWPSKGLPGSPRCLKLPAENPILRRSMDKILHHLQVLSPRVYDPLVAPRVPPHSMLGSPGWCRIVSIETHTLRQYCFAAMLNVGSTRARQSTLRSGAGLCPSTVEDFDVWPLIRTAKDPT